MNGPTQANEVKENVSPINSVPTDPPRCDAWSILVKSEEGNVISNAPIRLTPKTMKTSAIKPFTHGFDPSCTTPKDRALPSQAVPSP